MRNAYLKNGEKLPAKDYNLRVHGSAVYCKCGARVICVTPNNDDRESFYKTTGSKDSKHDNNCSEIRRLRINMVEKGVKFSAAIKAVQEEQQRTISLNLSSATKQPGNINIDEVEYEKPNYVNRPRKIENRLHGSIKSLSTIATLLTKNSAEELLTIVFKINGKKIPLSKLVIEQNAANEIAKAGLDEEFIVYGIVDNVVKREKVMYINFDEQDGAKPFALVVFANNFDKFAINEKIEGKTVLAYGKITPQYGATEGTQMILNNKQHIHVLT